MIKFFRNIRKKVLMENKTGKPALPAGRYLKYAIGEIILVVIGILIALQINNWNETRKLNALKQNYYRQILVDLETDRNYVDYIIKRLDSSITKYKKYNETFKQPNMTFPEILQNISENDFRSLSAHFESNTIESVINNGDMKLFDGELRNNLTAYNGEKERIINVYSKNIGSTVDILKYASMDGVFHNFDSKLQNQEALAKAINLESRYPEMFIKLEAFLAWKFYAEENAVKDLKGLMEEISITVALIDSKLEQ